MPRKAIGLTALLLGSTAYAHVAPSPDENNRYLKLTLLPDEVRAAYTIYFGERPGAALRQRMDANGDGLLDETESKAFGDSLRTEVAAAVKLTVDGQVVDGATWTLADVGLGQPSVRGGSFAVDVVAHAKTKGRTHRVQADDALKLNAPGEHEVRVDESPGVRVVAAHRYGEPPALNQLRWAYRGPNQGPTERSVIVEYNVDAQVVHEPPAAAAGPRKGHTGLYLALGLCGLGAAAMAALALRRPRDGTTGTGTGTSR